MVVLAVPYHLDERLGFFDVGVLAEGQITAELGSGTAWQRMAVLYEQVADVVAGQSTPPLVLSGDCTTSLAVLAGLQRAGHDLGVVWFDAHADFHTEATTTSGYLGGMPLALAAGVGTPTLPDLLGLRPVPESQILLVDARDTDPGEHVLLDASAVQRQSILGLRPDNLPEGDLYVHLDVDVFDPRHVPGLLYPVTGGPSVQAVLDAVTLILATGRVAAVGVAATWHHERQDATAHQEFLRHVLQVTQFVDGPG